MKKLSIQKIASAVLMASLSTYAIAASEQECLAPDVVAATTPTERFEILANGTEVKDTQTNLIWQRCAVGQTWDSVTKTCTGTQKFVDWKGALTEAQKAGNGYRVPNLKELQSIVEYQCIWPAVNTQVFPWKDSDENNYWSSTPDIRDDANAMYVYFYTGSSRGQGKKASGTLVRLVRTAP
ncbi:DUF1566 domain-containing protein [Psychrobacter sp. I-STPA6b]|uniref:Lcl C-terminal domain-containing protein n=1 Tax=Psychrobacter sp. I-STPA6b TaxID=2585718 RepID=UPI001D0C6C2C|nr:DUF1566 domain-containing protein [Psychrobacter sp. I-STPA6b]